jgi:hypothetical protein
LAETVMQRAETEVRDPATLVLKPGRGC